MCVCLCSMLLQHNSRVWHEKLNVQQQQHSGRGSNPWQLLLPLQVGGQQGSTLPSLQQGETTRFMATTAATASAAAA